MLLLSSIIFLSCYLGAAILCGAVFRRVDVHGQGPGKESPGRPDGDAACRHGLAAFLIGTALAPFVLAIVAGALWTVIPGRSKWVYQVIFWVLLGLGLLATRHWIASARRDCRRYIQGDRRRLLAGRSIALALAILACLSALQASRPLEGYDACTYALDARRVAQQRATSALMALAPSEQDPQFANHNHGVSYPFYLAWSLMGPADASQGFPVRMAVQILGLHVIFCVIGLSLRISGRVALLAGAAFLLYEAFILLVGMNSRDFYRILPLLLLFGLFRDRHTWPGFNWRGAIAVVTLSFLWNAHVSALMIAPLAFVCLLVLCPKLRWALGFLAVFLASIPLGAFHLIRAALETGDPLGHSPFFNANYAGTAVVDHWWAAREAAPAGGAHPPGKLLSQLSDGALIVLLFWAALLIFAVWLVAVLLRRRRVPFPPFLVIAVGLFLLGSELLLLGLLDPVAGSISTALSMNFRYRAHFYPLGVVLIGFLLVIGISKVTRRPTEVRPACMLAVLLMVIGVSQSVSLTRLLRGGPRRLIKSLFRFDENDAREFLISTETYRWLAHIGQAPRGQLVLMDYAYLGWYHLDRPIMFTQDPRVRPAFAAETPAEAVKVLDDLDVGYVYLIDLEAKAILNSGIALGQALQSPAFELVDEQPGRWYLYRRVSGGERRRG